MIWILFQSMRSCSPFSFPWSKGVSNSWSTCCLPWSLIAGVFCLELHVNSSDPFFWEPCQAASHTGVCVHLPSLSEKHSSMGQHSKSCWILVCVFMWRSFIYISLYSPAKCETIKGMRRHQTLKKVITPSGTNFSAVCKRWGFLQMSPKAGFHKRGVSAHSELVCLLLGYATLDTNQQNI